MTTPTAALVEEAEALNDLIQPGPFTKCGEDGDYWVENRHGQKLEEFRDRDMATFFARARTLVPEFATALRRAETELDAATTQLAKKFKRLEELEKRAEKAEAERDAQHALVLRLTGELEALATKTGDVEWREDAAVKVVKMRGRQIAELTATRDLLTAENARLQKEVATLELLLRGGK